jgi:hypothetical protein
MAGVSGTTRHWLAIVGVTIAIVGGGGWLAWDGYATAQAVNRDSAASDYLRAYAAAQAQYHARHRSFATVDELHQAGHVPFLDADAFEREGYVYHFSVSQDRAHFWGRATPTWQHGDKPWHWSVDETYALRYASDHDAGPADSTIGPAFDVTQQ